MESETGPGHSAASVPFGMERRRQESIPAGAVRAGRTTIQGSLTEHGITAKISRVLSTGAAGLRRCRQDARRFSIPVVALRCAGCTVLAVRTPPIRPRFRATCAPQRNRRDKGGRCPPQRLPATVAVERRPLRRRIRALSGWIRRAAGLLAVAAVLGAFGGPALAQTEVPSDWSLKPNGLTTGDQFRVLFLSSTKRDGASTNIADYNTFIQRRADIRAYSTGFRAVGCTAAVDARDNTGTTGTGVPIYWLNGAKAADNYADFYDGSWDDEANDKNESGTDGPDTSSLSYYPRTGCDHDGTEWFNVFSYALGAQFVRVGRPNDTSAGPLSSSSSAGDGATRPMYGLSEVFQVAAADTTAPTVTIGGVPETSSAVHEVGLRLTARF